jgi:putative chitinase
MITLQQFSQMIPTNRDVADWYNIAVELFSRYEINTPNRIAGFMAQCGHESSDFRNIEENMNYSWQRLRQVFPAFFPTDAYALSFDRQPQKIANFVYDDRNPARRNKLGNTRDGDGWRFRGSGLIHLTGRTNYTNFGQSIGMTPEQAAEYTRTQKGAFESACWFWNSRNLNRFCDADDIQGMSRSVNGGTNGMTDRINRYNRAKLILNTKSPEVGIVLQRGSRGDIVRQVQNKLGLVADGIFGPNTESAVKSWQRINRYTSDGILSQEQINRIIRGN